MSGSILAAGGFDGAITPLCERYHLAEDRWERVGALAWRRDCAAGAALDGRGFVTGGRDADFEHDEVCERFDPEPAAWTKVHRLRDARYEHALVAAGDRLYAIGGFRANQPLASVEIYDPGRDLWSPGPTLPTALAPGAAATVDGPVIWAVGPSTPSGSYQAWRLDLANGVWSPHATFAATRTFEAVVVTGGAVHLIGGRFARDISAAVERVDLATGARAALADLPTARQQATAVVAGGRLFVLGGLDGKEQPSAAVEALDLSTGAWERRAPMTYPRAGVCAVAL